MAKFLVVEYKKYDNMSSQYLLFGNVTKFEFFCRNNF